MLSLRNPSGITPYHPWPRPPSHRMPPGQLPLKARDRCVMQTVICYLCTRWMSRCPLSGKWFGQHFVAAFSRLIQSSLFTTFFWPHGSSFFSLNSWHEHIVFGLDTVIGMWDYARWLDEDKCQINRQTAEIPITFYAFQKVWWILPWAGKTPCEIIMSYRLRLKALLSHAQMLGRFK